MTPGTRASERLPEPLRDGHLKIRPLSLAEQFCRAGDVVGASDMHLRVASTVSPWARLFQEEPAYVLSQIVSFHAGDAAQRFEVALEVEPSAALEQIGALAKQMQNWRARIKRSGLEMFSKQIAQLNAEADLDSRIELLAKGQADYVIQAVIKAGLLPFSTKPRNVVQQARATDAGVRAAHALLRNAIVTLQPIAQEAFDARVASGKIDPALGLLLAELAAAELVDDQINDFVLRLTQHYYRDVIGQKPAGPTAERILLHLPKLSQRGVLPKGATLQARASDGAVQSFETEATVPVTSAKLISSAVLSYDTDPKISFYTALGGITGVRAKRYEAGPRTRPEPMFAPVVTNPVEMGLDISSPMFSMAEGDRVIEVSLNMQRSSNLPATSDFIPWRLRQKDEGKEAQLDPELVMALRSDPDLIAAFGFPDLEEGVENIAKKVQARARSDKTNPSLMLVYEVLVHYTLDLHALRMVMGRIVTLCLIEKVAFPSGDFWKSLQAKIDACRKALGAQQSAEEARLRRSRDPKAHDLPRETMIFEAFETDEDGNFLLGPEDVFEKLLSDAFAVSVTTAEGPKEASVTQVLCNFQKDKPGITVKLSLSDAMPAVTGPDAESAPVLSIRYAPAARICPQSFFERYHVPSILIRVRATGMRKLFAFGDDGPVSTDQTFAPFGARPKDGSTFWVGCPELAVKPVTHVGIDIDWSELPGNASNFEGHYEHYPDRNLLPDPKVDMEYLSRDGWKPLSGGAVPLFQRQAAKGMLRRDWHIAGPLYGQTVPAFGLTGEQVFSSRQSVRAGVVRMTLSDTGNGFLADDYPLALVKAVKPRVVPERLVGPRPVPPAPFVPKVAQLRLSYTAQATMELNSPKTARVGEKVVQVGPFGTIEVFPNRALRRISLFPERLGYGHLFMQIGGPGATGPLTLVFNMADSGHLREVPKPNPVEWYYLTHAGWQPVPRAAIASDSTAGLMRSGIVALDLPQDALRDRSDMPAGGVWVAAVAKEPRLEQFPALAEIETNGVWALRTSDQMLSARPRNWVFDPPYPGIGAPREVPVLTEVRPHETRTHFFARVGERLRHRKRGLTPWDIERLVLEAFPEVWIVKCLPHLDQRNPQPAPGVATVVLVRKKPAYGPNTITGAHVFDVGTLSRVQDYLQDLCPDFARIDVVNPAFQRIQVRATLQFDAFRDDGAMAQRLTSDLNDYLSVWTGPSEVSRFGWSINRRLLRAYLGTLDYVRGISHFSVLHLAQDDAGHHKLLDTAQQDYRKPHPLHIRPATPWSLPIAAAQHRLNTSMTDAGDRATQSGIGRLAVGDMLIVGQRAET